MPLFRTQTVGVKGRALAGKYLTGDKELDRTLSGLPLYMQKRVLKKGVQYAATQVKRRMVKKAKGLDLVFGGRSGIMEGMAKSIITVVKVKRVTIYAGRTSTGARKLRAVTGAMGEVYGEIGIEGGKKVKRVRFQTRGGKVYELKEPQRIDVIALAFEYGWRDREPQPFVRQTFQESKASIISDFRKKVNEFELRKAAHKVRLKAWNEVS